MAITLVCGNPGAGKSYYVTTQIKKYLKKGRPVFSNYPVVFKDRKYIYETLQIEREDISNGNYPYGSLIVIDEANHWFNSRNYKNFSVDDLVFFTQGRHLGLDMILISQHPQRIDVAIREIIDYAIEIKRIFKIGLGIKYAITEHYGDRSQAIGYVLFMHRFKHYMSYDTSYYKDTFDGRELNLRHFDIDYDQVVNQKMWMLKLYYRKKKLTEFIKGKYRIYNEYLEHFEHRRKEKLKSKEIAESQYHQVEGSE